MGDEQLIEESDVRAMVRLLADVAANGNDLAASRKRLLAGIAGLIGADFYYWALASSPKAGETPAFTILLKGGFTDQQFAQYVQIQEHPEMVMLNAPLMEEFCRQPRHITRHRGQLDPDNQFDQTEVHALWKNADIGPLILSMRPVGEAKNSAILLARRWHKPEFSDRENRIAHILLSEVPWLHQDSWPNHPTDQAANLSPRLNTITNLLLQGNSRKQMAAELDLSIHTVNEYVKHVYHLFGVHSQSALIHKFIKGDGGDLRTHP